MKTVRFLIYGLLFLIVLSSTRAEVHFYKLIQERNPNVDDYSSAQERSMWCWAACVQMAYRAQDAQVSQARIVSSIRGLPVNSPAYAEEVVRALTQIGHDETGSQLVSLAALFKRTSSGKLRYVNPLGQVAEMNAVSLAFLLGHGIPTIALYNTGGSTGHFVLITGVSINGETSKATHYQVEDPWPLNSSGEPISVNHAVRKQQEARAFERSMVALVIPLVYTDASVDRMRQLLVESQDTERLRRMTLSDLDELDGITADKYADVDDLRKSVVLDEAERTDSGSGEGPSAPTTDSFAAALSEIVSAAPSHFRTIKGKSIDSTGDPKEYECTVMLPSTLSSKVVVYSWGDASVETLVFRRENDTDKAESRYKEMKQRIQEALGEQWQGKGENQVGSIQERFKLKNDKCTVAITWFRQDDGDSVRLEISPR